MAERVVPSPRVATPRVLLAAVLVAALTCPVVADPAAAAVPEATTSADAGLAIDQRVERIAAELRCLVCHNQTIADSQADLAVDLRREVREQVVRGASDDQIRAFMVQRYGDFVLYRPPVKPSTWLLWGAPAGLVVAGLAVFALRWRRQASGEPDDDEDADRAFPEDWTGDTP